MTPARGAFSWDFAAQMLLRWPGHITADSQFFAIVHGVTHLQVPLTQRTQFLTLGYSPSAIFWNAKEWQTPFSSDTTCAAVVKALLQACQGP